MKRNVCLKKFCKEEGPETFYRLKKNCVLNSTISGIEVLSNEEQKETFQC